MMQTEELFGKRLKEIRKSSGLSQAELASKIGVDEKYISRLETSTSTPSFAMIIKLSDTLNTDIESFFKFNHLKTREELLCNISNRLKNASEKDIRIINKIIDDILV